MVTEMKKMKNPEGNVYRLLLQSSRDLMDFLVSLLLLQISFGLHVSPKITYKINVHKK